MTYLWRWDIGQPSNVIADSDAAAKAPGWRIVGVEASFLSPERAARCD
ncbi:hypothetical protein [Pseudomarimonas salicorniae]|uniref:Uncharacterized protein n=1 Tax=Pseudomarimonas salicorniae TaxID=2933270 RepID=A0ABT0GHU1_9GAMM|nr:hypothetical protein [Lysobacter sp. CAU 1642]MCK7593580.1 hypothetical protein [Lysobacter sp. CAU 1642]